MCAAHIWRVRFRSASFSNPTTSQDAPGEHRYTPLHPPSHPFPPNSSSTASTRKVHHFLCSCGNCICCNAPPPPMRARDDLFENVGAAEVGGLGVPGWGEGGGGVSCVNRVQVAAPVLRTFLRYFASFCGSRSFANTLRTASGKSQSLRTISPGDRHSLSPTHTPLRKPQTITPQQHIHTHTHRTRNNGPGPDVPTPPDREA